CSSDLVPKAVCHLWNCLDEQVVRMQFRGIAFRIREERIGSRVIFLCDDSGGGEAESREVRHGIGLAVAQYIRSYHEPHLVRDARSEERSEERRVGKGWRGADARGDPSTRCRTTD